jgi:hypothetical protein
MPEVLASPDWDTPPPRKLAVIAPYDDAVCDVFACDPRIRVEHWLPQHCCCSSHLPIRTTRVRPRARAAQTDQTTFLGGSQGESADGRGGTVQGAGRRRISSGWPTPAHAAGTWPASPGQCPRCADSDYFSSFPCQCLAVVHC